MLRWVERFFRSPSSSFWFCFDLLFGMMQGGDAEQRRGETTLPTLRVLWSIAKVYIGDGHKVAEGGCSGSVELGQPGGDRDPSQVNDPVLLGL